MWWTDPAAHTHRGAYYEPTLIVDAAQDSQIVQQEIFGPVLVCLPFDTDDEAITAANDTPYGLAASARSTNVYRTQLGAATAIAAAANLPLSVRRTPGPVAPFGVG